MTGEPSFDARVRAGVAMYNAGFRYEAHDAWEAAWLALEPGSDDERFLHGLIQFTAVVVHAHGRNWTGMRGLCESAQRYLAKLPDAYRGVDVAGVRAALAGLAADPERIERGDDPPLRYDGDALGLAGLDVDAALVATPLVAKALGLDQAAVEAGVSYAWQDLQAGEESSRFVTLAADVARETDKRGVVAQRLGQHVQRRRQRESDVAGLFD